MSNVIEGDCVHEAVYLTRLKKISMEYYSVIRKNEIMPLATTWIYLENIILSKVSQTREKKKEPYDFAHMWDMKQKAKNEWNKQKTKTKITHTHKQQFGG